MAEAAGRAPDRQELLARHPELTAELERFFSDHDAVPNNYTISQDGFVECYELQTGKSLWQERLTGPGSRNSSWSSVLLADGKIYVPNQSGDVFVLRAGPKFEVLGRNSIDEMCLATPVLSQGSILVRTMSKLYRIGAPNAPK